MLKRGMFVLFILLLNLYLSEAGSNEVFFCGENMLSSCNRDLKFCGSENLIQNSGFEVVSNGVLNSFTKEGNPEADSSKYYQGRNSIKLNRAWESFDYPINLDPTKEYIFFAYVKGNCNSLRLFYGTGSSYSSINVNTNEWTRISSQFRPRGSSGNLRLECANDGYDIWIDSVHLQEMPVQNRWVDNCGVCGCRSGETCGINNVCDNSRATIKITADDEFELYFNERLVGREEWGDVYDYDVSLQPGENVISIIGRDTGNREGLVFEIIKDGLVIAKSDNTVKAKLRTSMSNFELLNWKKSNFDDRGWEIPRQNHERRKSAAEGLGFSQGLFIWGRETHASKLDGENEGYAFRKKFSFDMQRGNAETSTGLAKLSYIPDRLTEALETRNCELIDDDANVRDYCYDQLRECSDISDEPKENFCVSKKGFFESIVRETPSTGEAATLETEPIDINAIAFKVYKCTLGTSGYSSRCLVENKGINDLSTSFREFTAQEYQRIRNAETIRTYADYESQQVFDQGALYVFNAPPRASNLNFELVTYPQCRGTEGDPYSSTDVFNPLDRTRAVASTIDMNLRISSIYTGEGVKLSFSIPISDGKAIFYVTGSVNQIEVVGAN